MNFDLTVVRQVVEVLDDAAANRYLNAGWTLLRIAERRDEEDAALFYVLGWAQPGEPVDPD